MARGELTKKIERTNSIKNPHFYIFWEFGQTPLIPEKRLKNKSRSRTA